MKILFGACEESPEKSNKYSCVLNKAVWHFASLSAWKRGWLEFVYAEVKLSQLANELWYLEPAANGHTQHNNRDDQNQG